MISRINFRSIVESYKTFAIKKPILSQSCTVAFLTTTGDILSQKIFSDSPNYDYARTARFTLYGFVFVGPVIRTWFGILERMFSQAGKSSAFKKLLMDQGVFSPLYQAVGISCVELLKFSYPSDIWQTLRQKYFDVLKTSYKIWIPAQMITFFFIPFYLRVLFTSCVALIWNVYFSMKLASASN